MISGGKWARRFYSVSTLVILLGILSIVLLLWVDRLRERQRNNAAVVGAIMEAQISASTAHLRLEEALAGARRGGASDAASVVADLDNAISLVDITIHGGAYRYGRVTEPLGAPGMRARAEQIRSLMEQFRESAVILLQKVEISEIGSTLDRRSDRIFSQILGEASVLESMAVADSRRKQGESQRLVASIISVWIVVLLAAAAGFRSFEVRRRRAEQRLLEANDRLSAQAEELKEHREHLEEIVMRRTAQLTEANARLRDEISERMRAEESLRESEKQIRHLSSELLSAEEIERRRISRELHDELGQSLYSIKLQLRLIEQRLDARQGEIRKVCEELLDYTDEVVENVRRLSRDLSPTVLEDLGLTAALKWLVSNFIKGQGVEVSSSIPDIDDLFDDNRRILIFRIIQELLTNAGKHAGSGHVSVIVLREDCQVTFVVEDDGKGFDLTRQAEGGLERGLGLAFIRERINMLGGVFRLWSEEGKGVRATFTIPAGEGMG